MLSGKSGKGITKLVKIRKIHKILRNSNKCKKSKVDSTLNKVHTVNRKCFSQTKFIALLSWRVKQRGRVESRDWQRSLKSYLMAPRSGLSDNRPGLRPCQRYSRRCRRRRRCLLQPEKIENVKNVETLKRSNVKKFSNIDISKRRNFESI